MSKAKVIEIVLFKTNLGVNPEQFKIEMTKYNEFLKKCEGFLARKIAVSADGQYIDIMEFANLDACNACAEKATQDTDLIAFQLDVMDKKIDRNSVYTNRFEMRSTVLIEADKPTVADIFIMQPKEGINIKTFESALLKFNDTLADYKDGLVLRENGVSTNGQYLELVYWADMKTCNAASEKGANDPEIESFFDMTDEEAEIANRFEIFSDINH